MGASPSTELNDNPEQNKNISIENEENKPDVAPELPNPSEVLQDDISQSFVVPLEEELYQKVIMPPTIDSEVRSEFDSSDMADIDDSWYVIPPPCFTGTDKSDEPTSKPKESSVMENALIEHPSIYIQNTAETGLKCELSVTGQSKPVTSTSFSKERPILLKADSVNISKRKSNADSNGWIVNKSSSKSKKTSKVAFAQQKVELVQSSIIPKQQPQMEKKPAKAWENKFIITNWNDDQDDINDDFDNIFQPIDESPKLRKQEKAKKRANKLDQKPSPSLVVEVKDEYESDDLSSSPAVVGIDDESSSFLVEFIDEKNELEANVTTSSIDELSKEMNSKRKQNEKRAPTQVKPIEPERQPGWQLRRKRSKRKPLSVCSSNVISTRSGHGLSSKNSSDGNYSESGNSSGSRSSPSFMDRIGNSIVANLANLTTGLQNGATIPSMQQRSVSENDKFNQSLRKKCVANENVLSRRKMPKSYLNRQNDCVKLLGNSKRRADRRAKMHTTPNGVSINRKVQTNFNSDN